EVKGEKVGKEPHSVVATRRLAKPRPVQGKQAPPSGGPPRDRVAAKRDGHPRQNPAYRPAKGKPCNCRVFPFPGRELIRSLAMHHDPPNALLLAVLEVHGHEQARLACVRQDLDEGALVAAECPFVAA